MTFADYLRGINTRFVPTADFPSGLVSEKSGAPDSNTSPFFAFAIDSSSDAIYWNPNRSPTGWVELVDASLLTDGQKVLTANI